MLRPETATTGWHYRDVLGVILSSAASPAPVKSAIQAIIEKGFEREAIKSALSQLGVAGITYYKEDTLDLLLGYANIILDDHAITDREYQDFELPKLLFKIQEGDFYTKRFHLVKEVINEQMRCITEDGQITLHESFTTANLQSMFDLSSEQFFSLWHNPPPSINRNAH